jgi:hypothetical protein
VNDAPAFFHRLGFSWDSGFEAYTPDLRSHPDRAPWPPTRPRN